MKGRVDIKFKCNTCFHSHICKYTYSELSSYSINIYEFVTNTDVDKIKKAFEHLHAIYDDCKYYKEALWQI
jgi:hypothetical protein